MAKIARSTHIPIATGERVFTKWGFREVPRKGGRPQVRLIAGMAEAFYAASVQLAASIPNFLCQERASVGVGCLKKPFEVVNGHVALPTAPFRQ